MPDSVTIQETVVRVTGSPRDDRVMIRVGEEVEISMPAGEALQFGLLLLRVASDIAKARLGMREPDYPPLASGRVM